MKLSLPNVLAISTILLAKIVSGFRSKYKFMIDCVRMQELVI